MTTFTHIEQAAIKMLEVLLTGTGGKGSGQANLLSQKKVALAKNNSRNVTKFLEVRKELVLRKAYTPRGRTNCDESSKDTLGKWQSSN